MTGHVIGGQLIDYIGFAGHDVEITIKFPPLPERKIAKIEFWFSTMEKESYTFINSLKKIYPII